MLLNHSYHLKTVLAFMIYSPALLAGDIPGVPITQPPALHQNFQIQLSNDFFTFFSNADDFRTQQITLSTYIAEDWLLVLDQSLLTFRGPEHALPDPPGTEGRLDQLSASLAYRVYHRQDEKRFEHILLGTGLRGYGNFSGARIQNGVHRMLNNELINLPYVDTHRTDAVVWVRASRQHYFAQSVEEPVSGNWQTGYWLDGTALQTTDGQFDATLGAYGLLKYRELDVWLGVRGDWRNGYERDVVQRAVAEHERGAALALGMAYGPLRLETIEGIGGNQNSFGRLVLSAHNDLTRSPDVSGPTFSYQFSLQSPEVAVQNQFRWSPWPEGSARRYALLIDHRFGNSALDDAGSSFNINNQIVVGLEAAFGGQARQDWIQPYVMLAAGYRSEYLEGKGVLDGQQSDKVSSAVLVGDTGVRLYLAGDNNSWRLQYQLGLTGWVPLQNKQVDFNGERVRVLESDLSWVTGVNMIWRY